MVVLDCLSLKGLSANYFSFALRGGKSSSWTARGGADGVCGGGVECAAGRSGEDIDACCLSCMLLIQVERKAAARGAAAVMAQSGPTHPTMVVDRAGPRGIEFPHPSQGHEMEIAENH